MVRGSLAFCLLIVSGLVSTCVADVRIAAFNVRVFGQKKVADDDVLHILVQVTT